MSPALAYRFCTTSAIWEYVIAFIVHPRKFLSVNLCLILFPNSSQPSDDDYVFQFAHTGRSSHSDRRVPADGGQESQASSWVEAWNSAGLSRCPRGERPLVELSLEPGVFSERCTVKLPFRVDCIHRREFGEVSGHRVLIKRGPGNRGASQHGSTHEATSGMSS